MFPSLTPSLKPIKKKKKALAGVAQWIECQPKGLQVNSWSGYIPWLRARSPFGGVREATDQCFSPSLSPSLPLSLKIKKKKKEELN